MENNEFKESFKSLSPEEQQLQIERYNEASTLIADIAKAIGEAFKQLSNSMFSYYEAKKKSKYRAFKHNKNKIKNVERK